MEIKKCEGRDCESEAGWSWTLEMEGHETEVHHYCANHVIRANAKAKYGKAYKHARFVVTVRHLG